MECRRRGASFVPLPLKKAGDYRMAGNVFGLAKCGDLPSFCPEPLLHKDKEFREYSTAQLRTSSWDESPVANQS